MVQPGEVDWPKVFKRIETFHMSGITPALSASATQTTAEALKAAKKAGCTVSYDLNYRKKLWTPAEAKKVQESMMADVDILITTEEDTNVVFGIRKKIMRPWRRGWPRPSNSESSPLRSGRSFGLEEQLDRDCLPGWKNLQG